ncbi:MAG: EscU/YscU/HrcU family type III secretion system export apparatus switch protein [Candidatus Lindowbacteria bacterium]|nr:EscU/YscU/HrcU family type III secretion system export apparatus switch protein [Candidatus Lindowbacteria bacterium]
MNDRAKEAVAVRYDQSKEASPRVIAKGKGQIAAKIMELAEENDIPIYSDPDLVALLASVELFDEVPPELFKAVAEVLVWVYKVNNEL